MLVSVSRANDIIDELVGVCGFVAKLVDQILPDFLAIVGVRLKTGLEAFAEFLKCL